MMSTSAIRGTLRRVCRPSASRQAAISLSAEFLAPPALTVPRSGPLARITKLSTGPSMAGRARRADDRRATWGFDGSGPAGGAAH